MTSLLEGQLWRQWGLCVPSRAQDMSISSLTMRWLSQSCLEMCVCAFYWDILVAQMVKSLPAMWETRVRSLCWKDPLEKEMATHSSALQ